jgi:predicted RNase H-like nuclease
VSGEAATVVGVDACKGGWVAVVLAGDAPPRAHLLPTIDHLERFVPGARVAAIDIPIGLLDGQHRSADQLVRSALGVRRSSLFMTPVRGALEADHHGEASARNRSATGTGISAQAFALRSKILEVERWLPTAGCAVVEVHPEYCFAEMDSGRPMGAPKRSWQGMIDRRDMLERHGITLGAVDPRVGARVPVDDLLDAAAAAWTARRVLAGTARAVPDPPQLDPGGRPIAIWV